MTAINRVEDRFVDRLDRKIGAERKAAADAARRADTEAQATALVEGFKGDAPGPRLHILMAVTRRELFAMRSDRLPSPRADQQSARARADAFFKRKEVAA